MLGNYGHTTQPRGSGCFNSWVCWGGEQSSRAGNGNVCVSWVQQHSCPIPQHLLRRSNPFPWLQRLIPQHLLRRSNPFPWFQRLIPQHLLGDLIHSRGFSVSSLRISSGDLIIPMVSASFNSGNSISASLNNLSFDFQSIETNYVSPTSSYIVPEMWVLLFTCPWGVNSWHDKR